MDVEKLILCVKKNPILYDSENIDYKNLKQKEQIWDEIADELDESVDELKKKWKNLRDCYARYLRSWNMKTIHTAPYTTRYYKFWPWAKQMEIFRPYLKFAQAHNESELNDSSDTTNYQRNPTCPSEAFDEKKQDDDDDTPHRTVPSRKRKQETESSVDKVLKYLRRRKSVVNSNSTTLNGTEHMFLSFAKTIATFSATRQAAVKMRIANMVLEEELLDKEEKEEREENALKSTITPLAEDREDRKF